MRGNFNTITAATGVVSRRMQTIGDWSERVGVLYQPNPLQSYHFSWGTSFNTSADTYSYSALSANTPPEQSRNIEFGAKLDSADKRFTTRLAIFQSTKYNERNTDPDSAATAFLLSGKRHSSGMEIDSQVTTPVEVFGSTCGCPTPRSTWPPPPPVPVTARGAPALTPIPAANCPPTRSTPVARGCGVNFRRAIGQPQPWLDGPWLRHRGPDDRVHL
jgi:catecholate siderophore receptor